MNIANIAILSMITIALVGNVFTNNEKVEYTHEGITYDCIYVAKEEQSFISYAPDQLICFNKVNSIFNWTDYEPYFFIENNELVYF